MATFSMLIQCGCYPSHITNCLWIVCTGEPLIPLGVRPIKEVSTRKCPDNSGNVLLIIFMIRDSTVSLL